MGRLRQAGVTLVELIIAVVIISIAVTGILLAFVQTVRFSADPMIQAQALAIAEGYMDEILAKPVAGTPGCIAGAPRADCATVSAYNGLNGAPSDQLGNAVAALSDYTVNVSVGAGSVALGGDAIGSNDATVSVTVTRGSTNITLRGYKVDY